MASPPCLLLDDVTKGRTQGILRPWDWFHNIARWTVYIRLVSICFIVWRKEGLQSYKFIAAARVVVFAISITTVVVPRFCSLGLLLIQGKVRFSSYLVMHLDNLVYVRASTSSINAMSRDNSPVV